MSSAGQAQTNLFGQVIGWVKDEVTTGWSALQDFVSHKALPFLTNLINTTVMDEVAALAPLAEQAAEEVIVDLPLLASPGAFLGAVTQVAINLFQKAQAAGLQVAETSIQTAAHAAVANKVASAANPVPTPAVP